MGIIVSSFKGCGKRTLLASLDHGITGIDCGDIDSETDIDLYIDSALSFNKKYDFVFVSAEPSVRRRLNERGIDFDLFYPSKERRNELIEGLVKSHENAKNIAEFDKGFIKRIQSIDDDDFEHEKKHKLENSDEFIGNNNLIIQYIISLQE